MPPHPTAQLPPEKRTRLFQVAGAEFAAAGFRQASLNRIIAAIGMSKSSFYHYFSDKADLYEQMLQAALQPLTEVRNRFDPDGLTAQSFWPLIGKTVQELTEIVNHQPELVLIARMFYRSFDDPDERALTAGIMAEFTEWIDILLARGQALGLIRDDLPRRYLLDLVMAMGMATDRWMLAHWETMSERDRQTMNNKIMALFLRLLTPA